MTTFKCFLVRESFTALRLCVAVLAGLVVCLAFSERALAATGPVWSVTSLSTPTNLTPGSPANEVQNLTVDATEGTFRLAVTAPGSNEATTAPIAYDASPFEIEIALYVAATFQAIPIGSLSVTGGPGGPGGVTPYTISWVGELAGKVVPLRANGTELKKNSGTEPGSATVSVVSVGVRTPQVVVMATNVGGGAACAGGCSQGGVPIVLSDVLPADLTAIAAPSGIDSYTSPDAFTTPGGKTREPLSCSALPELTCTVTGEVVPGDTLIMSIPVSVPAAGNPVSVSNEASVSGGGAAAASVTAVFPVSSAPAEFGVVPGSLVGAISSVQAGAHPDLTTAFALKTSTYAEIPASPKDIRFDLPPGLVGSTAGVPTCTMVKVIQESCPADSMVGMATIIFGGVGGFETTPVFEAPFVEPVYDIKPSPGEPFAFAFTTSHLPVRIDTSLLSNGDYAARATAPNLTEVSVLYNSITIWGVPADHQGPSVSGLTVSSDRANPPFEGPQFGGPSASQTRVPLLNNPQQCSEALTTRIETDSWANPGHFLGEAPSGPEYETATGTLTGCSLLPFGASFSMLPDTLQAGAPAGYSFDLQVPQSTDPDGLATPNVKAVSVTLPAGTVISPSAANGLAACSDTQFGLHSGVAGSCPRESQVGTVEIKTPALPLPLQGEVYLAEPECDPCTPADAQSGRMVRLFVQVIGEGESGIIVKLEGKGEINQQTGQVTTVFENNPQLPFSELKLSLGGGPRATLANPGRCGAATTNADLTPWSTPYTPDATPSYSFEVNGCTAPRFSPSFDAGMSTFHAGGFGQFTLAFGREDADQDLNGLQLQMPPGLLGMLSAVTPCGEPFASQGTCGPASLIGHVQVLTGPGAEPFLVTGGQVYLTASYKGAPYGLSIVVPAKAGPYVLAGTTGTGSVVVRAAINVDPNDAHLTVTSDPLPTMLDGIPLALKVVNVTIDRAGFTFNPTNCDQLAIPATLTSTQGASASVSYPFKVADCAALKFKPGFAVSTSAHTSRADGASLDAKVTFPKVAQGTEANIAKVKVDLPKQLPSRLTTLQKACAAAVFDVNPANCPAASVVGIVRASTPVLPVGLTGPVYFVSHGGEAFPSLIVVLQGDGVRVDLVGTTFISKAGITSSTFKTVPDVPISSFELYLPEGPHSALAANGNLCTGKLLMPTAFVGQNGAEIHETTTISVTGCPKAKPKAKPVKAKPAQKASMAMQPGHASAGTTGGRQS